MYITSLCMIWVQSDIFFISVVFTIAFCLLPKLKTTNPMNEINNFQIYTQKIVYLALIYTPHMNMNMKNIFFIRSLVWLWTFWAQQFQHIYTHIVNRYIYWFWDGVQLQHISYDDDFLLNFYFRLFSVKQQLNRDDTLFTSNSLFSCLFEKDSMHFILLHRFLQILISLNFFFHHRNITNE